jgi:predicted transposase/invertase (TIGR01784 family)
MPKFRKKEEDLATHLDYWLYYLNNLASTTEIPDVLKKDELLQEAFDVAEFLALGKDEQFSYKQDVKARWDNKACLDFATETGFEKGIEKAMEKSAKTMIKKGLDLNLISEITGISINDLQLLANVNNN